MHKSLTLNSQQKEAVSLADSHLLIVAGPGTGKTHTLVERILSFVPNLSKNEKVLAITFTNKAANEMKQRLSKKLGDNMQKVDVGTFHKIGLKILREQTKESFSIGSPDEISRIFKVSFPDLSIKERREKLKKISDEKQKDSLQEQSSDRKEYDALLKRNNIIDFDDILINTLDFLRKDRDICIKLQNQYRYIFVDEYQDINDVQHVFLKTIISSNNFVTAIGDPNQAIYGFRGSDIRFFDMFTDDFPGAQKMSLTENYRSSENILKASGQVIEKSRDSGAPSLIAKMHAQGNLVIFEASTDKAEAEYIVHTIEKMVGGLSMFSQDSKRVGREIDGEYSFGDMAVLYRLNAQGRVLEEAFKRSGIPYQVSGDKRLAQQESALKVISETKNMKDIAEVRRYLENLESNEQNIFQLTLLAKEASSVEEFTDIVFLQKEDDAGDPRAEKVLLLTLHAAKGLEFDVVFIAGCEKRLIPLEQEGREVNLEEERRLFYVGMTRAKKTLYLLRSKKRMFYGKIREAQSSPFLLDIEENLKSYEQQEKRKKKSEDQQLKLFLQ